MKLVIITFFLLLLPSVHALTCNNVFVVDKEVCEDIVLSDLHDDEKQQLIADLVYTDREFANHDFIEDWNKGITFNQAPNGIKKKSVGYIKDAWLKIIAILPSVIQDEILLTSGQGKILSAYNYKIKLPTGKESGDCKTIYSVINKDEKLSVYLNDDLIGTSQLTDFSGDDVFNFKAELYVRIKIKVKHYQYDKYCCRWDDEGNCIRYCKECNYDSTEYRSHKVDIDDSRDAYLYSPNIDPKINIIDSYYNTIVGYLDISDFSSFVLDFKDSYYKQSDYQYNVDVGLEPYDVFTLKANKLTRHESNNININKENNIYKFYVSDSSFCKINYYDHFYYYEQDCNLNLNLIQPKIETDKLYYKENEDINLILEPKNTYMEIMYGDELALAKDNIKFNANKNYNKITAILGDKEINKIIHVKDKTSFNFVFNFGVFYGVLYSFYFLIKKYVFFL